MMDLGVTATMMGLVLLVGGLWRRGRTSNWTSSPELLEAPWAAGLMPRWDGGRAMN